MSTARSARRQLRRADQAFDTVTHLTGRSILILFSEIDHLTDGREIMDIGRQICAQGATPLIAGPLGELAQQLEEAHCVALDIPLHKRGFFTDRSIRKSLSDLIARAGIDLVHGVGARAALFGAKLAEASGVPFAATLVHPLSDHFPKEAEAVVAAQRIFIANPEFTEEFLDMAPHVEERAQLATQGVDLDLFTPSAIRSADIVNFVERHAIPHHKPVMLIKACADGGEVQSLLVEALKDFAPLEFLPLIEVPRGSHKFIDRLERDLTKAKLGHEVRLMETQDDPRLLYQIADVVLVDAFKPLSFNRTIAEAGAFGKPVLVPLTEGIKSQVQHDVNGWIFTTQSHQTLKAAIAKALTINPDRRKTMAAAAQLHVRTHFNSKATSTEVLAAYEALLAADQPFPGIEDMMDFDGDPLEIAAPDARGLSLIAQERKRRRGLSLKEGSPAVRTAMRDHAKQGTAQESLNARLAERLNRLNPNQSPTFAQPQQNAESRLAERAKTLAREAPVRPTQAAPPGQPFDKTPKTAPAATPVTKSLDRPADAMPAPRNNFSLLELAKQPGGPVPSRAKEAETPEPPAVDLQASFHSLLKKT